MDEMRFAKTPRPRAVTLLEVMVVLAIAGILATLAVPSFQDMAVHYRAQENARGVLQAMSQARGLSQRENQPMRLVIKANNTVAVERPTFGTVTPQQIAASTRRLVVGYAEDRVSRLPEGVVLTGIDFLAPSGGTVTSTALPGAAGAVLVFCSSGETYYRDATTLAPVCRIGSLTSASAKIRFTVLGKPFNIRINEALGTVDLRTGS
jgi:prepilin-type N-terminal cleavage/methylation domain-containing protein